MRIRHLMSMIGMIASTVLVVAALWAWTRAESLSADLTRPDIAQWAIRSAAIASLAIAQLLLLTFVAGKLSDAIARPRSFVADALRLSAGVVAAVALVSAVALGLAGGLAGGFAGR